MENINQYFVCKPNTPITEELDRYFEETHRNFTFLEEFAESNGIESRELAWTRLGGINLVFIPTKNDLEKFKNRITEYERGYYRFRANTKIYRKFKEECTDRNIKQPKVALKDKLNIRDHRNFWLSVTDISCGFVKYKDTYLLEIDTHHIVESEYLEEVKASTYYKMKKSVEDKE